jgi:hypothetical protein
MDIGDLGATLLKQKKKGVSLKAKASVTDVGTEGVEAPLPVCSE